MEEVKVEKKKKKKKVEKEVTKCSTCIYRAERTAVNNCDYILIAKHSRGCPPGNECTKYIEGTRIGLDNHWRDPVMPELYY